jgi:nucleoid-associated protein YgaU
VQLAILAVVGCGVGAVMAMHPGALVAGAQSNADGIAVTAAAAWCVVTAASWWLGGTCFVGLVASRSVRGTPRYVRHLVEVALVGSCVVGSAVPASATTSSPVVRDVPVVRMVSHRRQPARASTPVAPAVHTHVVQPGENLWQIARTVAGASDVMPYWHALVAENQATLRSGNPNLIFPGEILRLPAQ